MHVLVRDNLGSSVVAQISTKTISSQNAVPPDTYKSPSGLVPHCALFDARRSFDLIG
eukprot:COSAG05_NODE_513_length_9084_cov_5.373957_3_plen_57_part_00